MMNMMLESNAYPALTGEVVTERHARICRERGHATHTVDGVDQGSCPRCGENTEEPAPISPKFAEMVKLEESVRFAGLGAAMAPMFWERDRAADQMEAARAKLYTLFDSLTPAELAAFGEYRRSH